MTSVETPRFFIHKEAKWLKRAILLVPRVLQLALYDFIFCEWYYLGNRTDSRECTVMDYDQPGRLALNPYIAKFSAT